MKITVKNSLPKRAKSDMLICLISKRDLNIFKKGARRKHALKFLDAVSQKIIRDKCIRLKYDASDLSVMSAELPPPSLLREIVLVGTGESKKGFDGIEIFRKAGGKAYSIAQLAKAKKAVVFPLALDDIASEKFQALIEGLELAEYSFDTFKSKKTRKSHPLSVTVIGKDELPTNLIQRSKANVTATTLARDLINMPSNKCTPSFLVREARKIAASQRLSINVYSKGALKRMGAGALLGVAQASAQPPYLIRLRYAPRTKVDEKHIAIVGKGITFDSGGLSIKIGEGMYTMKSDMSGAAAVLAVMSVIRSLKIQRQVTAYIPTCENMVSDRSQKPGDIVKAINGKTIEVVNTDAEGRLILADALSLAVKDGADIIIDLATLTGACMVALGAKYAGLFSTSRELAKELIHAGEKAGERLWELPLAKEYEHQLKNTVADVRNISGTRWGGAVTAALFLKEFVGRTTWAHIDIAGPAFASADDLYIKKGGVGFGVRTLINWLSRE